MQTGQGVFIAIEGTDGSGKGTQFEHLAKRLVAAGYDVATFDFPQYEQESSFFVREYLNGKYGSSQDVGPYTASLFYALDRYQAAPKIREALEQGKVVLANRFVGSSMAHQGTKFHHAEERRGYFIWLDNLEFEMLRIPRPNLSYVLRVPAEIAQGLVDKKAARSYTDKKRDIHEADLEHLQKAVEVYDDMCQLFPKDFVKLDCTKDDKLMSITAVQNLLWKHVQLLLPAAPKGKKGSRKTVAAAVQPAETATEAPRPTVSTTKKEDIYYVPATLNDDIKSQYRATIDKILGIYGEMAKALLKHLATEASNGGAASNTATHTKAYEAIRAVLPVAVAPLDALTQAPKAEGIASEVARLAAENLPATYSQSVEPLQLSEVWPRNELDIVADMLYQHSELPLKELRELTASWSYDQKLSVYETYIAELPTDVEQPGSALDKMHYGWDIVSEYGVFRDIHQQKIVHDITWQPLTPRYGYEIPTVIEAAGLSDSFEVCFDLSLQLHSALQAAGYLYEAQYATLYGHRVRWKLSHNASKALMLYQQLAYPSHPAHRQLLGRMLEGIGNIHPLLADTLSPEA